MRSFAVAFVFVAIAAAGVQADQPCTADAECDDGNLCTVDTCASNVCVWTPDLACGPVVDNPLPAKKLKLRIPPGNPGARGMRMLTTDGALSVGNLPAPLGPSDPVVVGGSVRVFTTVGDQFDRTYALPHQHWDYFPANTPTGQGYQYKDNHNEASPIGVVKILAGTTMKMKGKGGDDSLTGPMDFSLVTDPNPVNVVLTLGSQRYCFSLGGERFNFKEEKIFWAKLATAPAACP
jgi:hypothetical protein